MDKIVKDKSILVGDELLVKKKKWVEFSEINESMAILNHKLFDTVFEKIVTDHTPNHRIAFFSLCTSTRPYQLGRKWKVFLEKFNEYADMIVVSSGGIIPQKYWNSYPFLNYDGHTTPTGFEKLYEEKMTKRMLKFLKKHRYDYIIANFRPNIRNANIAHNVLAILKDKKIIKDYKVIPDDELYKDVQKRGFPSGKVFPDLDVKVLEELNNTLKRFKNLL